MLRPLADPGGHIASRATRQQGQQPVGNPHLRLRNALAEDGSRRFPYVFQHVHHIDQNRYLHADPTCLHLDRAQLFALTIDPYHLVMLLVRIAAQRILKGLSNHLARRLLHTRPYALVGGSPPLRFHLRPAQRVHHIGRCPGLRLDPVHRRHLRHSVALALVGRAEPHLQLVDLLVRCKTAGLRQILMAHHHALGIEARAASIATSQRSP